MKKTSHQHGTPLAGNVSKQLKAGSQAQLNLPPAVPLKPPASVWVQLSTPSTSIEIRGGSHTKPLPDNGRQRAGCSYAQATRAKQPGSSTQMETPTDALDPEESRRVVLEAMKMMSQPEERADPTKVKRNTLSEEAIERIRSQL
ncbi:hypothetical protein R1sor_020735 [Riccia sorocarpa]|uniref:Uncharacterized protein n=1 Tax=Riccia sorocarpa TaxID=122646 RepID=A0ABD3GKQ6_9MARC